MSKFAIIAYLFAGVLLFIQYMLVEAGIATAAQFNNISQAQLENATAQIEVDIQPNPEFIFGDFSSAAGVVRTIFDFLGGGPVAHMIEGLPGGYNPESFSLLIRFVYGFSLSMLLLQIFTGRGF